jgi:hypothetical protein
MTERPLFIGHFAENLRSDNRQAQSLAYAASVQIYDFDTSLYFGLAHFPLSKAWIPP